MHSQLAARPRRGNRGNSKVSTASWFTIHSIHSSLPIHETITRSAWARRLPGSTTPRLPASPPPATRHPLRPGGRGRGGASIVQEYRTTKEPKGGRRKTDQDSLCSGRSRSRPLNSAQFCVLRRMPLGRWTKSPRSKLCSSCHGWRNSITAVRCRRPSSPRMSKRTSGSRTWMSGWPT